MIEILDRYTQALIYKSETATTIKQAVEEAVVLRANLAGANLADAYLARANLAGANLSGANLARANLAGAYLADANLAGAYLAGANLARANLAVANLAGANLAGANLAGAYLAGAYLADANLADANLARANLARANLAGANLAGANLARANLADAKGINSNRCTPLRILLAQVGKIRAWKLVTKEGFGPYAVMNGYTPIRYEVGVGYECQANTDENEHCSCGISLATLDWCMKEWMDGYRILLVEFDRADLACVPTATDGRFRVHRCRVVEEVDLATIGIPAEAAKPKEVASDAVPR